MNDGASIRQGLHIEWQRAGDANSDGTMIIAWSDCRNGGIRDVIVQKIDIDGTNLWGDYGVVAVNAVVGRTDLVPYPYPGNFESSGVGRPHRHHLREA